VDEFTSDLCESEGAEAAGFWFRIYQAEFGDDIEVRKATLSEDLRGIDDYIIADGVLRSTQRKLCSRYSYQELPLEVLHCDPVDWLKTQRPGWAAKPQAADYLFYAWLKIGSYVVIDRFKMQEIWGCPFTKSARDEAKAHLRSRGHVSPGRLTGSADLPCGAKLIRAHTRTDNRSWNTYSIALPIVSVGLEMRRVPERLAPETTVATGPSRGLSKTDQLFTSDAVLASVELALGRVSTR